MGHEVIAYGRIDGAPWRSGDRFTWTHDLNSEVLAKLPNDDDWPWVTRGIFALPAPYPQGMYRTQVIHFGLSMKDEPTNRGIWDVWLSKFEGLLRQLYWWTAVVHLETEFEPPRTLAWLPTEEAMRRLLDDSPMPVTDWVRSLNFLERGQA